ncbi:DUF6221 family protein [Streptomyces sp. BPPL-273]|uniref:DUF6221 family protein n=1 Tax=Streptomyces sp. BPPL-273 TaxID=2987533 RepID=UPI0024AED760|nr:DUF6221 family protein [Streptomyces sp. BPPL-273]WHM30210.1 DUF6221 family protein [Streptomyces sp. BPPL-273]
MSDIADFLRARYAEQRAIAEVASRTAGSGDWRYDPNNDHVSWVEFSEYASPVNRETWWPLVTEAQSYIGDTIDNALGEFIAVYDPDTVLADLDAKLAIVDLMDRTLAAAEGDSEVDHYGGLGAAEETLCRLAQPFAGHPEHKGEEWTP